MRSHLFLIAALASATASCADGVSVSVKYAPGYRPAPSSVSVLGVFRDGRMSSETWSLLGPALAGALGAQAEGCDAAYSDRLQQENPDLYTFLEEDTRTNGITEEMLAKMAERAEGGMILAISVHGKIVQAVGPEQETPQGVGGPGPMRGGPTGRGRGGMSRSVPRRVTLPGGLELTATLYSVAKHKSLARLGMTYTGSSMEEATKRFATEVAGMMPGSACKSWRWKDDRAAAPSAMPAEP